MNGYKTRPKQAGISVEMKDEDIIKRIADLWGVRYHACTPRKEHHSTTYKVHIRGERARDIMAQILPYMGQRRGEKIREILGRTQLTEVPRLENG